MAHDADAGAADRANARERGTGPLELDHVGTALLEEAHRVVDGVVVRRLVGAEGHVPDDQGPLGRSRDRAGQEQHLVERHRQGRVVAENDHRRGVADEDQVDSGRVREPRAGRVVRGDHDDLLATRLHLEELGESQLSGCGSGRAGLAWTSAHADSSFWSRPSQAEAWHGTSRITLSIKRVLPTRTAAASTRGSKSATST